MNEFDEDFYGHRLRAIALGYVRPESGDFKSLEDLIHAIRDDVTFASHKCDEGAAAAVARDAFLRCERDTSVADAGARKVPPHAQHQQQQQQNQQQQQEAAANEVARASCTPLAPKRATIVSRVESPLGALAFLQTRHAKDE